MTKETWQGPSIYTPDLTPHCETEFPTAQQEVTKSYVGEWLTQKIPSPWEDQGFTIDT